MDKTEALALVARMRREMPRHPGVLALCAEVERLVVQPIVRRKTLRLTRAEIQRNYRLRRAARLASQIDAHGGEHHDPAHELEDDQK